MGITVHAFQGRTVDTVIAAMEAKHLVDNPKVGDRLINSHWRLVRLGPCEGTLVLSDRPLVRLFGYEQRSNPSP